MCDLFVRELNKYDKMVLITGDCRGDFLIKGKRVLVGFGENNEEFGKVPPSLISCEEIKDEEGFANNSLLIKFITCTGINYEITFPSYIMHLTINESYMAWDDYEIREGIYLITFTRSRLMDFYDDVIIHDEDYSWPGRRKHYGVYTADHIIDVISDSEPIITQL